MPSPTRLLAIPALASALLLSACVKPAEQAAPAKEAPPPEPFSTAGTVAPAGQPSVAGIPAAAIAAAERAKARVEVASTATADNGVLFKQAQALAAERKFSEALQVLNTIQPELLTPAQEKAVAELRTKLTQSLAAGQ